MKLKNYFLLMALGLGMTFGLSSCSDDDDPTSSTAQDVTSAYTVYVSVDFSDTSYLITYPSESLSIVYVSATSDNMVNVLWSGSDYYCSFGGATVTETSSGTYSISGTGTFCLDGSYDGVDDYDATLTGTISDGSSSFVITASSCKGGTTITMTEGTAPTSYSAYGTYSGYTEVEFAYTSNPYGYIDQSVLVGVNKSNTSLVDVFYSNDVWGDYEVTGASLTASSSGVYTISGSGTATMASHSGGTSDYDCTVSGSVGESGQTLVFSMPSVMGGTTITFTQSSSNPAAYVIGTVNTEDLEDNPIEGSTVAEFAYGTLVYENEATVSVTPTSASTVDVTFTSETWGTATFTDVDASSYSLSAEGTIEMTSHSGDTSSYSATLAASFDSDGKLEELTVTASGVMGGTVITFYEELPAAYAVTGTYTGTLAVEMSSVQIGSVESQSLTITGTDEDVIELSLAEFTISVEALGGEFTVGSIDITGIDITQEDDGSYTISNDDVETTVEYGAGGYTMTGNVTGTLTGTITISEDKTKISLSLDLLFDESISLVATFTL